MAQLTPLSKSLIGLIVVGAMASAAWHLKLKDRFGAAQSETAQPATTETGNDAATPVAVVPALELPPEKPAQTIQEPPKAPPAANLPAPKPAHSKPAQASADPWSDLNIDKKGNKP